MFILVYIEGALCVHTSVEIGCCMGNTSVEGGALYVYTSVLLCVFIPL